MTEPGGWRPVPPELDIPGSVYESRTGVTGAAIAPDEPASWFTGMSLAIPSDYSYFADVSQFQGVPVDASYRHPILSFRLCDGAYFDPLATQNWANASRLLADASHPLELIWVYFVYRPGMWDAVAANIRRLFPSGRFPDRVAAMIDAEPWGGQVSGNHSNELNQWAAALASRTQTGYSSVVGYSYSSAFAELWPQMDPRIKRHTASYGTWDPSPYGWQYSGGTGTGGLPGWPHGAGPWPLCDMNVIKKPISQILADFGFTTDGGFMAGLTEAQQQEMYRALHETEGFMRSALEHYFVIGGTGQARVSQAVADEFKTVREMINGVPTAAEIATAVKAILPTGSGPSLEDIRVVVQECLNSTRLVSE